MAKHKPLVIAILDRDITQIEIAKKARMHESRLSRIINGHDVPTPDEKKALARILRRTVDQLFPSSEAVL